MSKLLTIKDLAECLQIGERTVYEWATTGKNGLPGIKIGGSWRFRKEDIDQWLKERGNGKPKHAAKQ